MRTAELVVFTAVAMEAKGVAGALGLRRMSRVHYEGDVAGQSVSVRALGIRAVALPSESSAARIILAGFAGALDPALNVGDIVTDAGDGRVIATADQIVATAAQKAEWFARTGARAVDMEGAIVAAAAARWDVPFMHVRAITDRADQPLDPAMLNLVDPYGRLRVGRLAVTLARRPTLVPPLVALGRASAVAGRNLAAAVRSLLTE